MLLRLAAAAAVLSSCSAAVRDAFYDCQLREIALDYTREVILGPAHRWSEARSLRALSLVSQGLKLDECRLAPPTPPPPATPPPTPGPLGPDGWAAEDGVTYVTAPNGKTMVDLGKRGDKQGCKGACRAHAGCNAYTWHDEDQGGWANACIGRVTNGTFLSHLQSGHFSGHNAFATPRLTTAVSPPSPPVAPSEAGALGRAAYAPGLEANGERTARGAGAGAAAAAPATAARLAPTPGGAPGATIYVSPNGSDAAAGTLGSPLRSIAGAQALIRSRYPKVATRPAVTVLVQPGDYFFGAAGPDHLVRATQYSGTSIARFTEHDSGASPAVPITYAAAQGAGSARFIGGVPLTGLAWAPAGAGLPGGVVKAKVPGSVAFDAQDQLFAGGLPLVRARTPNGRPWVPMDGFNLTVENHLGTLPGPDVYSACYAAPTPPPAPPPHGVDPRPATPAPGECVAAPNVTLLNNLPNGLPRHVDTESAAGCMTLCKADPCCLGFTWHDQSTARYYKQCYLVKLGAGGDAWQYSGKYAGHQSGLCNHSDVRPPPDCSPMPLASLCVPGTVVCDATNVTQITGSLGVSTAAGAALAGPFGEVRVSRCLEHLLSLANDWPSWKARSYGVAGGCDDADPASCVNALDTTYNFPLWFGPWAAGIEVNASQDAGVDISRYKWPDASNVVVHAMADGEWGGVQFRVKAAAAASANPVLNFSYGGFQQARGASLGSSSDKRGHGNRFYMEGSIEFLDAPGEWHFDPTSRELYVYPPAEARLGDVLLTQTDTLFEFTGSASDPGSRVENIVLANLSLGHTSAQFFRPHEETSGGDYATHRSGAVKAENATGLTFVGNEFTWVGGNAVFLSASVRNVTVTANLFRWLGTSGVAVQGKTGAAMMDGRDGEAMMAAHGAAADNGVRLPKHNLVSHNVFADYGIWDKQSACYHKALAPENMFLNNVCFNSSRHGVNFQDGMGGAGIAEGNVMFNLNRETSDTTAFNSWNRRNYITSDSADPRIGILVPQKLNEWRRNLVLGRDYYGIRDGNGNGLRNDDGASFYNHSHNVIYRTGIQFNGGTQIWTYNNMVIYSNRHFGPTPDVAGGYSDIFVDTSECLTGNCVGFWNATRNNAKNGIYRGDFMLGVANSTGNLRSPADWSKYYCGMSLAEWQKHTGQDLHTRHVTSQDPDDEYSSKAMLAKARAMLWAGQGI